MSEHLDKDFLAVFAKIKQRDESIYDAGNRLFEESGSEAEEEEEDKGSGKRRKDDPKFLRQVLAEQVQLIAGSWWTLDKRIKNLMLPGPPVRRSLQLFKAASSLHRRHRVPACCVSGAFHLHDLLPIILQTASFVQSLCITQSGAGGRCGQRQRWRRPPAPAADIQPGAAGRQKRLPRGAVGPAVLHPSPAHGP